MLVIAVNCLNLHCVIPPENNVATTYITATTDNASNQTTSTIVDAVTYLPVPKNFDHQMIEGLLSLV